MALNAKTDPNYVPKRTNGKFAPGVFRKPWRLIGGYA